MALDSSTIETLTELLPILRSHGVAKFSVAGALSVEFFSDGGPFAPEPAADTKPAEARTINVPPLPKEANPWKNPALWQNAPQISFEDK